MHSLIYSASPKYVMMIPVEPRSNFGQVSERKVGANKDREHPRRTGCLNLLKWQRCTLKIFLRAHSVSKLNKILCGIKGHF